MEHQEITLIFLETLVPGDEIFLASSQQEAQEGNTQQGTLLGWLVLLLKIRGVGVQRRTRVPESLLAVLCLENEGKRDQRATSTEPGVAGRSLCHISRQGQSEERGFSTQKAASNSGHP